MVILDGKKYDIVMEDEIVYTSIFDFLQDKKEYRDAFLKRYGDELNFKNEKDLERYLRYGGNIDIIDVIEGDTDEIAEIMDMLAKENEFYAVDYIEREDIITIKKFKIMPSKDEFCKGERRWRKGDEI